MTLPSNDFSSACYFCGSKVNYPFYIYRRNELDINSDDMIAVCSNHLHRPSIIKLGDEHGNYIDYKLSQKADWIGPEGDPRFSYGEKNRKNTYDEYRE